MANRVLGQTGLASMKSARQCRACLPSRGHRLTRRGDGVYDVLRQDRFHRAAGNSIVFAAPLLCDAQWRFEMANVADRIVATLEAANVRRIYGLVGDSLNGITESLRVREKIEWIAVRHEEVAAFAAGAQAQLTGELA